MQPSDLVSVYGEMAELVGVENAFKIYEHFKGQQMNFPQRIYSQEYVERYVKEHYCNKVSLRVYAYSGRYH